MSNVQIARHKLFGAVPYRILRSPDGGKTVPIDIDDGWEARNIVRINIPQLRGVDIGQGRSDGSFRVHRAAAAQFLAVFEAIERAGLKHLLLSCAGTFYPRMIRGSTTIPSEHSFGGAIDINAGWNGLGRSAWPIEKKDGKIVANGTVLPLTPIFEAHGFREGGKFKRRDWMHKEIARLDAGAMQVRAARELALNDGEKVRVVEGASEVRGRFISASTEVLAALGLDYAPDEERTTARQLVLKVWEKPQ